MSFQNSSFSAEPRIEDSILFEVNEQTLTDMNLTEHISRLEVVGFLPSKWGDFWGTQSIRTEPTSTTCERSLRARSVN